MAGWQRTLALTGLEKGHKLLVVGCNGFIGHAVATLALSRGVEVTGLSLHPPAADKQQQQVTYINADISNSAALSEAIGDRKFDYVINCSGYIDHTAYSNGGRSQFDTHFHGLLNLVDCVNHPQLKGFVQIGSSDEYGDALSPQREDMRENPISPYACAKVAASHFIQTLHRTEGFPGVVARLFLVYGPGQNMQRFIPQVISGCLKNNRFPVSKGEQVRDFCFIDDVAEALLKLLDHQQLYGQVCNIASGRPVSIASVIQTIRDHIGAGEPEYGKVPYRTGENMSLYADIDKVTGETDWRPTTDLGQGIEATVRWYRNKSGNGFPPSRE